MKLKPYTLVGAHAIATVGSASKAAVIRQRFKP
jgi:hypothetical protein